MVKDPYEGFTPDRKPAAVIAGAGIVFFITSCAFALTLFPLLFASHAVQEAQRYAYINPTGEQIQDIVGIIAAHFAWMLAPFIVAGYVFRKRRAAIAYACLLVAAGVWLFGTIPFSFAGRVLLLLLWAAGAAGIIVYRKEFD